MRAAAVVIGGIITLVPAAAGLMVVFDPLRKKTEGGGAVYVGSITSLPENGEPRKFPVLRTQTDIWNRTPNVPVGSVYLQRTGPNQVRALNAKCPHTGCPVNFQNDVKHFVCPCHKSTFAANGAILDAKSPSPRALDELDVEIRNGTEIYVRFQNYRSGVKEKIAV